MAATDPVDQTVLDARARVLHDLGARALATAEVVSLLEEAISDRTWWVEQWPEGLVYIPGLIAQDVQDGLLDAGTRWPTCHGCDSGTPQHTLSITPDLGGPDPMWVCEEAGEPAAPLGAL